AGSLAETLNDHARLARTSTFMCVSLYLGGELNDAVSAGQRALELGKTLCDVGVQGVAHEYLGFATLARTDYGRAAAHLREAVRCLEGPLTRDRLGQAMVPSVVSHAFLGWTLAETGMFRESLAVAREGVRLAELIQHPATSLMASYGLGVAHLRKGEFAAAVQWLERSRDICRESNLPVYGHYILPALASAYARSGRVTEAVPVAEEAVERNIALGFLAHHGLAVVALAEVLSLVRRMEDARNCAERAVTISLDRDEPGHQAYGLHLLGEIAASLDRPNIEFAERCYQESTAVAADAGMGPLIAHCHLGLGKLYRRTGKREQAQEHLTTATTMYRDMDMRFWLEQAEAIMGALP
ncbi:MAG TPA: tetratricopeptide repeat protein, partial [Methylomirabilota bacterium]|nr:tetratricopeptide repeat protein [Methylomirabilota bacterium]